MSPDVYTELINCINQQSKVIDKLIKELQEKENLINELMKGA